MSSARTMSQSRTYPVAVDAAFAAVLPMALEHVFARRYGPLPPVRSVDAPGEPWGSVGQQRTVHLAGGGSMREELVTVDAPREFRYTLTGITGLMSPLASKIDGAWIFAAAGTGTRITWQWIVHPANPISARLLPVFGRLWAGYARQALAQLEATLV